MNLIGIETSTENCSVGLSQDGHITYRSQVAPQKHAELVLGYLDELLHGAELKKTQIDGIVFGQGPGAFTGVRIAMSLVQGLALALEVPVMAVSTMQNLAYQVWRSNQYADRKILVGNDARMGEVYWAAYETKNEKLYRITDDALNAPQDINLQAFDVYTGSAFQSMIDADSDKLILADALPNAKALLEMTHFEFSEKSQNINQIKPSYIREKVVFN